MILRRERYRAVPWANGGGITHDIVVLGEPAHLRLSLADIDRDGPFSNLFGYDRTIVVAGGAGFHLAFAGGESIALAALGARHDFRGEPAPECTLIGGPALAFNVMTLRDVARADLAVAHVEPEVKWPLARAAWLFVIDGELGAGGEIARRHDTLVFESPASLRCTKAAIVVAVSSEVIQA